MYTAKIKSKGEPTNGNTLTVLVEIFKDEVYSHDQEIDVKAASYEDAIKQYLISYKEAQEAIESIQIGKVISI